MPGSCQAPTQDCFLPNDDQESSFVLSIFVTRLIERPSRYVNIFSAIYHLWHTNFQAQTPVVTSPQHHQSTDVFGRCLVHFPDLTRHNKSSSDNYLTQSGSQDGSKPSVYFHRANWVSRSSCATHQHRNSLRNNPQKPRTPRSPRQTLQPSGRVSKD
jgi:hypothetical protein